MSEKIYTTAIVTPAPGSFEKLKEIFVALAKAVESDEPGVLKYEFFEQVNGENGNNTIIVHEIYKDRETFNAHLQGAAFKAVGEKIAAGGLVEGGLDIRETKPFTGFTR